MYKIDPTVSTLSITGAVALGLSLVLNMAAPSVAQQVSSISASSAHAADSAALRPAWAASATGRIEPKDGEIRIDAQVPGRIVEVGVKLNDHVQEGDLLVRLDDEELFAKYAAAEAEVLVRVRERDEEPAKGIELDRRKAEDALAAAERAVFEARQSGDEVQRTARVAGKSGTDDIKNAANRLKSAKEKRSAERDALAKMQAKDDMPLPTRLESGLTIARAELTQVEQAIERTRIRAPSDGVVLNVWAKAGETAKTIAENSLVLFGDLSSLRVRAEVEERDVVKIRTGQRVVVRADAYPDRDFEGVVTSMAPALGPPHILSRGPRRPNDVEVLEVLATLDGQPVLLTGMRVDVFFRADNAVAVTPASPAAPAKPN
ncbi:MAG: efflux RND transporter periplasmic adaptor subunit [Hyphomicrobium sp.]